MFICRSAWLTEVRGTIACYDPAVGVLGQRVGAQAIAGEFTGGLQSRVYLVRVNLYGTTTLAWDGVRLVVQTSHEGGAASAAGAIRPVKPNRVILQVKISPKYREEP